MGAGTSIVHGSGKGARMGLMHKLFGQGPGGLFGPKPQPALALYNAVVARGRQALSRR